MNDTIKLCKKCGLEKPSTNDYFSLCWNRKDGFYPYCKDCVNKRNRERHKNGNITYKTKIKKQRLALISRNQEYIFGYLSQKSCIDCGENRLGVLEFDHVRGEKKYSLCEMAHNSISLKKIIEEISKCEVRCANCHRLKTNNQFGYLRNIFEIHEQNQSIQLQNTHKWDDKISSRYWKHVNIHPNDNACWDWIGAKNGKNIGTFRLSEYDGTILAHRFSYEITFGSIPDGYLISHTCTNNLCVNPKHLVLSTRSDNAKLRELKRGKRLNSKTKLTIHQIKEIRKSTKTASALAREYKVSRGTIRNVQNHTYFKYIT